MNDDIIDRLGKTLLLMGGVFGVSLFDDYFNTRSSSGNSSCDCSNNGNSRLLAYVCKCHRGSNFYCMGDLRADQNKTTK